MATAVAREQAAAEGWTDTGHAAPGPTGSGSSRLHAQRDAPLGGQAVLEGVMMRGVANWAIAVRKPPSAQLSPIPPGKDGPGPADGNGHRVQLGEEDLDTQLGEIEVSCFPLRSPLRRHRILRLPIVRGVVALGESLAIGFRALSLSANAQLSLAQAGEGVARSAAEAQKSAGEAQSAGETQSRGEAQSPGENEKEAGEHQEIPAAVWAGTVVLAVVFAIGLFFLLPVGITSLIKGQLGDNSVLFWLVEGLIRTAIFLGYMFALSRVRDLRRVFEYHGAEHKTISCYEAGLELTPASAQRFSRLHPRCGTSFLLVVMIVAIFVFAPIGLPAWYWLVLTRILGVPVIAGISFEIIKFAGRNRRRGWVQVLMWPGLKLQLLTTREPDLHQLAVAIAALKAVLAHETPGELSAADLVGVEVVA
jgi:uncharacterized protein YqhQ